MGIFTAFFDLGFGLGALIAGAIVAVAGYQAAFFSAAIAAGLGVAFGVLVSRRGARSADQGMPPPV